MDYFFAFNLISVTYGYSMWLCIFCLITSMAAILVPTTAYYACILMMFKKIILDQKKL